MLRHPTEICIRQKERRETFSSAMGRDTILVKIVKNKKERTKSEKITLRDPYFAREKLGRFSLRTPFTLVVLGPLQVVVLNASNTYKKKASFFLAVFLF